MLWMGRLPGMAQRPDLAFNHLTPEQGLPDGKVAAVAEDVDGFIWLATGYGLIRYDGYAVTARFAEKTDSTTIPNNQVRRLLRSSSGELYITTLGGLARMSRTGQLERFPCQFRDIVYSMTEWKPDQFLLSTNTGLWFLDATTCTTTPLRSHPNEQLQAISDIGIRDMVQDSLGRLYMVTTAGLVIIDTQTWTVTQYRQDDRDPNGLPSDDTREIALDSAGYIWLSTDYAGSRLCRFDPFTGSFRVYDDFYTRQADWADNRIMDLLVDSRGRLWVSSLRAGLAVHELAGDHFEFYLHDPADPLSLSSNSTLCLHQDRNGLLWVGTEGYGVDYLDPDAYPFHTIGRVRSGYDGLADQWCRSIAVDVTGHYWIGTYKGLSRYDPGTGRFTNYLMTEEAPGSANNSVRSVVVDHAGTLWIGTGNGLNRLDPGKTRARPVILLENMPSLFTGFLLEDRERRLWACTSRGLFRQENPGAQFIDVLAGSPWPELAREIATMLFEDASGGMWISLTRIGLVYYHPQKQDWKKYSWAELNAASQEFDYITSIAEDKRGILWLGTYNGLIAHDPVKGSFDVMDRTDGLITNKVSGLLVDTLDRLWFGTGQGLGMLDRARKDFHFFTNRDGLPANSIYEGTAQRLPDGRFAYPTYNGIVIFAPEAIQPRHYNVPVFITGIERLAGPGAETSMPYVGAGLRFSPQENAFQLTLTGLHFRDPGSIRYAYKMEGFDPTWRYSEDRRATYTNVPGGTYTFRYKAFLAGQDLDAPEKTLVIRVGTVYYKTGWFITLVSALLLLTILGAVRWRLLGQQRLHELENRAQLLEKEKALVHYENLKQHLNPHFLFNSLPSLKSLIRVDQQTAAEFLERMSRIYRYILKSRDHELVSLQQEIAFAQTYIDLQRTRFREGLQVTIDIPDELLDMKVVPVTLQNLIENAIKHNLTDPDDPLRITITTDDGYLIVSNNLQRKEFVETSNRQGLDNMKALYQYLDPRPIRIEDGPETFTVKIPLI